MKDLTKTAALKQRTRTQNNEFQPQSAPWWPKLLLIAQAEGSEALEVHLLIYNKTFHGFLLLYFLSLDVDSRGCTPHRCPVSGIPCMPDLPVSTVSINLVSRACSSSSTSLSSPGFPQQTISLSFLTFSRALAGYL